MSEEIINDNQKIINDCKEIINQLQVKIQETEVVNKRLTEKNLVLTKGKYYIINMHKVYFLTSKVH